MPAKVQSSSLSRQVFRRLADNLLNLPEQPLRNCPAGNFKEEPSASWRSRSGLVGMLNLLQRNFSNLNITIHATQGEITDRDYEDKIRETIRQIGLDM